MPPTAETRSPPDDPLVEPSGLPRLWGPRGLWRARLRWAVAPSMVAGALLAESIGFELETRAIVAIAIANLLYNLALTWIFTRWHESIAADDRLERVLVVVEVVVDYAAMLLLLHFTGGAASPLVFFFLFHVLLAAIQFSAGTAFLFAFLASAGLWALHLSDVSGRLVSATISFRGEPLTVLDRPALATIYLAFFTVTLFLAAAIASRVMTQLRRRVEEVRAASEEIELFNRRLRGLYSMACAVSAERSLDPVLEVATRRLSRVFAVPAVSVKLLTDDGASLRYAAAHGLPDELVDDTVIRLERSPLNRRVLEGETLVRGSLAGADDFQLRPELEALGLRSAIFTPLEVEDRVIGVLGVYARGPEQLDERDSEFVRLAARLVTLAIENARANEAIEGMTQDRIRFMLEVAHNLRAPLSAGLGMLELVESGRTGEINERQSELLRRLEDRLRALDRAIGQLLTIARARDFSHEIPDVVVDLSELAALVERTFRAEAEARNLRFEIQVEPGLPTVESGVDLLREMMENLVSNAIRYTPEGGEVRIRFERAAPDQVRIIVRDSGIGIPRAEKGKLFQEFFRASNAKRHSPAGTGLGLALVKRTVDRHHGRIRIASAENRGTLVVIEIPFRRVGAPIATAEAASEP